MKHVHLLGEPFKKELEISRQWSQSLPKDRLLPPFHLNAGFPSVAEPLGGWERLMQGEGVRPRR